MVTVEFTKEYNDENIRIEYETHEITDTDDSMKIFDVIITKKHNEMYYLVVSCVFHPQFKEVSVRNHKVGQDPTDQDVFDGPHLFNLKPLTQVYTLVQSPN